MTSSLPQTYRKKVRQVGCFKCGLFMQKERMKNIRVTTVLVLLERSVRLPVNWNRLTGDGIPFLEARSNHGG